MYHTVTTEVTTHSRLGKWYTRLSYDTGEVLERKAGWPSKKLASIYEKFERDYPLPAARMKKDPKWKLIIKEETNEN